MITAYGTVENAVAAMKAGAFHYVTKPFKNDEVRHLVAQAVQTTRLRRENKDLRKALEERNRFEKIVGKSRPMQEVYRFIEQVAPSRSTVLIQGESGTGKELVAQAIHRRSPRAEQAVHRRQQQQHPDRTARGQPVRPRQGGVHRGRNATRSGCSRRPTAGRSCSTRSPPWRPAVQAKLLRVIQEKEFLPLGSVESRTVDVRILAATNEDIEAAGGRRDASARTCTTGST